MTIFKNILAIVFCIIVFMPFSQAKQSSSGSYKSHGSSSTTNVNGYTKKNGTYVAPHKRTSPNGTQRDNWTSKPNQNPYTGKDGTKEPQR